MAMKKALHLGLIFLFVIILVACTAGKQSAIEVKNATSKTRFAVSPDGVISDAGTGLEWITGPDQDSTYQSATIWVTNCKVAGGGWRMPTVQELKTLYLPGVGQNNMDPAFKTTGSLVWAEPFAASSMCRFDFSEGNEKPLVIVIPAYQARVLGVRSRQQ
jgi:hypothetical protein